MTSPVAQLPTDAAPPVVAVMVVHEPGDWFAETLAGLAAQDYPNLQLVALLTGSTPTSMAEEIRRVHPDALVRFVEGNPGFGPVANQVLSLVSGADGFFLVMHDDVALDPEAVSRLVEEAFRSNAAVVGPKLVEWDAPGVLQHVGLDADRTGQLVDVVDPGERDQEQHDAIRDTFALPSACMLVRNDVFRELNGFDRSTPFLGEELDFCWRVHMIGARVLVNPASVARHRGGFMLRASVPNAVTRAARHRVRTVVSCSSVAQLPVVVLRLVVTSLVETIVGLFTGRYQEGLAGLRAVGALALDTSVVAARRRSLRPLRRVPAREVASLQLRTSARLVAYARHRRALREQHTSELPVVGAASVPTTRATTLVGVLLFFLICLGNRELVWGGIRSVGQFLPMVSPESSPLDLARLYVSGWSPGWFGVADAAPTYVGTMFVAGTLFAGNWSGLLAALVVGSFFVAAVGAWRLGGAFGDARVRMFSAIVYVALPIGIAATRDGRRDVLLFWALLPWILDFARRLAGLRADDVASARETSVRPTGARRSQLIASMLLVVTVVSAFVPVALVLLAGVALLMMFASLATPTPLRASAWWAASPLLAVVGAVVLHLPWSLRFVSGDCWGALVGPAHPSTGASALQILTFGVDNVVWRWLLLAAYAPVVLAAMVARGWQHAWVSRAIVLVAAPLVVRLLHERDVIDVRLPEPLMFAPLMAIGITVSGAVCFNAYLATRAGALTWRRLMASLAAVMIVVALVPSAAATVNGRWQQPEATLSQLIGQLPDQSAGDYAVLYLGDPRILPMASVSRSVDAVAYGVTRGAGTSGVDTLPATPSVMTANLARAVDVLLTGESLRAGRLLAPFAIRYVVVPIRDGTSHSRGEPLRGFVHDGVVRALAAQLDFRRVYTAADLVIFENAAALPTASVLDERGAVASKQADEAGLLAEPLTALAPFASGFGADRRNAGESVGGTVHIAVPYSQRWTMSVDGARVPARVAFGMTTAFDAPVAGSAEIRLASSRSHQLLVLLQVVLWLAVIAIAFNPSRFRGRMRAAREAVEVSLRSDDQSRAVGRLEVTS